MNSKNSFKFLAGYTLELILWKKLKEKLLQLNTDVKDTTYTDYCVQYGYLRDKIT